MTSKVRARALALAAVVSLAAPAAMAQEFPSKPVVIVVGPGNRQGSVSYNDRGVDFFGNLFGFGG